MADDIDQLLATPMAQTPTTPAPNSYNHGPRDYTDEELGIATGPEVANVPGRGYGGYASRPGDPEALRARRAGVLDTDTTAQNVVGSVLAGGAGKLIGPVLGRAGPVLQRAITGGTEGAIASKESGGSALAGGVIGAVTGGLGGALEGAPARVRARALKDVVQGEGEGPKPRKPLRDKLAERSGPDNQRLNDMLDEDPALEHTLSTAAARHPKEASAAVQDAIDRHMDAGKPAYQAITSSGGMKLTSVTGPLQKLMDSYKAAGKGENAEAVEREINKITKLYGGKEAENAMLTGDQIHGIRGELGTAAFPDRSTPRAIKDPVNKAMFGAVNQAMEDHLTEHAPGVNLDRFKAHNQRLSLLIPMRKALDERIANEKVGNKSVLGRMWEFGQNALPLEEIARHGFTPEGIRNAAVTAVTTRVLPSVARAAAQAGRHIDYGLSRVARGIGDAEPAAATEFVRGKVKDAAADQLSPEDAIRAGTVAQAAKAGPPRLLRGLSVWGRPATAAERNAAGLPASLEHAINTNDPNLGHASLANELFGHPDPAAQ